MTLFSISKSGFQSLLLVLTSTFATLILVEAGFRVYTYLDRNNLESLGKDVELPAVGEPVTLGQMLRVNRNPNIIYDLIPDLSVTFLGEPVNKAVPIAHGGVGPIAQKGGVSVKPGFDIVGIDLGKLDWR